MKETQRFETLDYVVINAQRNAKLKEVHMADKWVLYNPTTRNLVGKQGDENTSLRRAAFYTTKGWADRTNAKLGGKFEVRQAKTLKQAMTGNIMGEVYPVDFEPVGEGEGQPAIACFFCFGKGWYMDMDGDLESYRLCVCHCKAGQGKKECPKCKGEGEIEEVMSATISEFETCPVCEGKRLVDSGVTL